MLYYKRRNKTEKKRGKCCVACAHLPPANGPVVPREDVLAEVDPLGRLAHPTSRHEKDLMVTVMVTMMVNVMVRGVGMADTTTGSRHHRNSRHTTLD